MESPTQVPAVELRISISETDPLIWRQLVLPESATVAELHSAIQCAFGWKNAHLYALAGHDQAGKKRIITRVAEDDDPPVGAEEAAGVELRELFDSSQPGRSSLEYDYDFGDNWTHEIAVVGPAVVPESTITCTGGAMRGPVEDSGGVYGYANVVRVVGDPSHPEHRDAVEWLELVTQEKASMFDAHSFDLGAVNQQLNRLAQRLWPGEVTADEMEFVLAPALWFLEEAHPDGLPLTSAGYLKPIIVKRAMSELEWHETWHGNSSTENHVAPVRIVREHLQEWKLLRKNKDRLVLTPAGRKLVNKPAMLWHYIADRLAVPQNAGLDVVTRLKLHWELSGSRPPWSLSAQVIQLALNERGLQLMNGAEIPIEVARELERDVYRAFLCLRLWGSKKWGAHEHELSDAGIKFLLDVQRRLGDD